MLYQFLKILATIGVTIYYRKIYFSGNRKLDTSSPTLIACNHPAGFMEPIILACLFDKPLHFLVRGDLFKKPHLRWLMVNTNQIPIFRFKDGFSNMRDNKDSMNAIMQAIKDNAQIMIFVEGSTELDKKLRKIQKGLAKMAYDALDADVVDKLKVLTIGINFDRSNEWRSDVMIDIGEYETLDKTFVSQEKPVKVLSYTKELYDRMLPQVIHFDDLADQAIFDLTVKYKWIDRRLDKLPIWHATDEKFKMEKNLSQHPVAIENVESINALGTTLTKKILLVIGFPIFLLAFILHGIPFLIIKLFTDKLVKKKVFYSSLQVGLGVPVFFFYYLLFFFVLPIPVYFLVKLFIMVTSLFLGLWYVDIYKELKDRAALKYQLETSNP